MMTWVSRQETASHAGSAAPDSQIICPQTQGFPHLRSPLDSSSFFWEKLDFCWIVTPKKIPFLSIHILFYFNLTNIDELLLCTWHWGKLRNEGQRCTFKELWLPVRAQDRCSSFIEQWRHGVAIQRENSLIPLVSVRPNWPLPLPQSPDSSPSIRMFP